jgi:hypothetical protein
MHHGDEKDGDDSLYELPLTTEVRGVNMNPDPQSSNDRDDVTLVMQPLLEPDRVHANVTLPLPKVSLKKLSEAIFNT